MCLGCGGGCVAGSIGTDPVVRGHANVILCRRCVTLPDLVGLNDRRHRAWLTARPRDCGATAALLTVLIALAWRPTTAGSVSEVV